MQTEQIVALLIAERDRLTRAIDALRGGVSQSSPRRRGRPPKAVTAVAAASAPATKPAAPAKRKLSAAGRRAIAAAAKKRWAAIRAGKAPSPFANVNKKKK
jgi:hypothetical protein